MSNFVVAKGVERLDKDGMERVVGECKAVQGGRGMISESSHKGHSTRRAGPDSREPEGRQS